MVGKGNKIEYLGGEGQSAGRFAGQADQALPHMRPVNIQGNDVGAKVQQNLIGSHGCTSSQQHKVTTSEQRTNAR